MRLKIRLGIFFLLILGIGLACQLTSPTPASWSRTPTARARGLTSTAILLTQAARSDDDFFGTPTQIPVKPTLTVTHQPNIPVDGPWLLYPGPAGDALHAFDLEARKITAVELPQPIYWEDLKHGLSPDGRKLFIRAGSPTETDQLALYEINLLSGESTKVTPLLTLLLQRRIVNQQGTRAFDVLEVVTRPDGLAWSPDSRYLAFCAALDNQSTDLYLYDSLNNRISRVNGLATHNATPMWGLDSNWLVSQELNKTTTDRWRSENVSGFTIPGFDDQNTFYLPGLESQEEVFVGWLNTQNFIAYSQTSEGPSTLRRVNAVDFESSVILQGNFDAAALDPDSQTLVISLSNENATPKGKVAGVYLLKPDDVDFQLLRGGFWADLSWDPGGMFLASGKQGLFAFNPDGQSMVLPGETRAIFSPIGNWMVAWGEGGGSQVGARLYQPPSIHPLQSLTENDVQTVFWQPDSKAFFLQSQGELYQLAFPGLQFNRIEDGFPEDEALILAWMTEAGDG